MSSPVYGKGIDRQDKLCERRVVYKRKRHKINALNKDINNMTSA